MAPDRFSALGEARAMSADLASAETLADMAQLHSAWIGTDIAQGESFESARDILRDYIREFCYATGVHCTDANIPD